MGTFAERRFTVMTRCMSEGRSTEPLAPLLVRPCENSLVCNISTVLDWNHNAYYHRLLLGQLPQRCHRVLDVGCGAGSFAARLARAASTAAAASWSGISRNMFPNAAVPKPSGFINTSLIPI